MTNIDFFKINIIKYAFIIFCSYITCIKFLGENFNKKDIIILIVNSMLISVFTAIIKEKTTSFSSIMIMYMLVSISFGWLHKNKIGYSMLIVLIALSFNFIIWVITILFTFVIISRFSIQNDFVELLCMIIIHIGMLMFMFRKKKLKYGISSLKNNSNNQYVELIFLNISVCIIFSFIIFADFDIMFSRNLFVGFIIFSIIMFITIQKSLQLYYKQQMLIKDLNETKEELENKKKEIAELEEENIRISKKNHTIVHKQKSIEHKLEELLMKTEISTEEAGEVKERLEKLHNQIYSEKENIELDKTGISNIDDMLKYMQSECIENKIEFTLVLKGNIHYMVNNLISKEDLETLLADHIKDAIIAINHTDNINKSVLVKLGNIDETYSLYIYDSGVEFKKEVLENLGKKPYTTHKDEGGTGMGFMNTFDTLRKCKASLIIEEFNKPCSDNYTKVIEIKFDNKNNFIVKSYQGIKIDNIIR